MLSSIKSRIGLLLALCAIGVLSVSGVAGATYTPQDYSPLTDNFGSELSAAVPIALAAVGLFIGVILAFKVIRRMLRA